MLFAATRGLRKPQRKKACMRVCLCVSMSQIQDLQNGGVEDANTHHREICTQETLGDFETGSCSQLCSLEIVYVKLSAKPGIYRDAQQKYIAAVRI